MMRTIENTVKYIRSKNAGPFWLTIDAFCNSVEDTEKVAAALGKRIYREILSCKTGRSGNLLPETYPGGQDQSAKSAGGRQPR